MFAFPDSAYSESYLLNEAFAPGAIRVSTVSSAIDPHALTRAEVIPESPLAFTHAEGTWPPDFMGTTWAALSLISDRVLNLFRKRAFSGWRTYPVVIHCGAELLTGFHGLAVTGRSAPPDFPRSPSVTHLPAVPRGRPYEMRVGFFIAGNAWDGSDVFLPEGTSFVVVRQRVADALSEARVSNVSLKRLDQFQREWPE